MTDDETWDYSSVRVGRHAELVLGAFENMDPDVLYVPDHYLWKDALAGFHDDETTLQGFTITGETFGVRTDCVHVYQCADCQTVVVGLSEWSVARTVEDHELAAHHNEVSVGDLGVYHSEREWIV